MANKKISELNAIVGALTGAELLPVVQGGNTRKATLTEVLALAQPLDADLTAIAALGYASTSFLKKTGAGTWALDTNTYQVSNANLTSLAALSYVSGSFVKMTGANTFTLDTNTYLTSVGTGVANELTYWSGTNTLGSLATATYPSLTELSYVKGVTSAIQTQLGSKVPTTRSLTINGVAQDLSTDRTWTIATDITIGTTAINSGTAGRLLFESATNKVEESANLFWDITNSRLSVGAGASPSATIHGKGSDSTSSNYALKVDNSGGSGLWWIRNDGQITSTTSSDASFIFTSNTKIHFSSGVASGNYGVGIGTQWGTSGQTGLFYFYKASGQAYGEIRTVSENSYTSFSQYGGSTRFSQEVFGTTYGTAHLAGTASLATISSGKIIIDANSFSNSDIWFGGYVSGTPLARITNAGNKVLGHAAIATNATDGFVYFPTCAGTPTGTPTAYGATAACVVDSTNNKMYIYSGGAWVALN